MAHLKIKMLPKKLYMVHYYPMYRWKHVVCHFVRSARILEKITFFFVATQSWLPAKLFQNWTLLFVTIVHIFNSYNMHEKSNQFSLSYLDNPSLSRYCFWATQSWRTIALSVFIQNWASSGLSFPYRELRYEYHKDWWHQDFCRYTWSCINT